MALPLGHRIGIKLKTGFRNGLSAITNRHGVPFYSPAEVYDEVHNYISPAETSLRFTLHGKLSGAKPNTNTIVGSTMLRFLLSGRLSGTVHPVIPQQSIKAGTTLHFFTKGKLSGVRKLIGETWLTFGANGILHDANAAPVTVSMVGNTSLSFSTSGLLKTQVKYGLLYNWWAVKGYAPPVVTPYTGYGCLYNWYAIDDARNICAEGWHVPTEQDFLDFVVNIGGELEEGGETPIIPNDYAHWLKTIGTTYWSDDPSPSATNEFGFNLRGAGMRFGEPDNGTFQDLLNVTYLWTASIISGAFPYRWVTTSYDQMFAWEGVNKAYGHSIRLVKDSTTLTNGQTRTYTGNDGKVYGTICIGTQEWLSENLAETKYRNLDAIPAVTDDEDWAALTTGAYCWYNNTPN